MTFSNGGTNTPNSKQYSYKRPFEGWRQEVLDKVTWSECFLAPKTAGQLKGGKTLWLTKPHADALKKWGCKKWGLAGGSCRHLSVSPGHCECN